MSSQSSVSIVIPAYNAEAYLNDCLSSVMGQADEIIVVDDGSTDSTPAIASGFDGVRLISTPNRGLASARNEGIRASSGQWLVFVDADDCLLPGAVARLLDIASSQGAEAVRATFTANPNLHAIPSGSVLSLNGREALIATLYQQPRWLNSACASIFRADKVKEVMFTDGIYYEDLDFTARLYPRLSKVCSLNAPVYFYRPNSVSFLNTFSPKRLDVLLVTERIERRFRSDASLLRAARSRRLSACFNMYLLICRFREYADVARLCINEIKRLRGDCFADPRVRLKNKLGIIASYIATPFL